ncbi:MAG: hypothetical protein AAF497_21215, partial [Planctomycetota bacterium]
AGTIQMPGGGAAVAVRYEAEPRNERARVRLRLTVKLAKLSRYEALPRDGYESAAPPPRSLWPRLVNCLAVR